MKLPIKLNRDDLKIYRFWRAVIYLSAITLFLFFSYRMIFPTKIFTFSFKHSNSLKNTITNVSSNENSLEFYASTPEKFSKIKIEIELNKKKSGFDMKNKQITLQKSYRAFFFPKANFNLSPKDISENKLIASGISVFIVGNGKKYPINNPVTFENMGYDWDNVQHNSNVDLSLYKKQKLLTISSTHPDGTIFKTDKNDFYFIKDNEKIPLKNVNDNDFENAISVNEKSLKISEKCKLKKNILFSKKYYCYLPLDKLSELQGKDFRFTIKDIPNVSDIENINLKFEKTANMENFKLFVYNLKKRLFARFGIEQ